MYGVVPQLCDRYHLSLRFEVNKEDVTLAIKNALTRWHRKDLTIGDQAYFEGAAMPSGHHERYVGLCWNETSVDGARRCARILRQRLKRIIEVASAMRPACQMYQLVRAGNLVVDRILAYEHMHIGAGCDQRSWCDRPFVTADRQDAPSRKRSSAILRCVSGSSTEGLGLAYQSLIRCLTLREFGIFRPESQIQKRCNVNHCNECLQFCEHFGKLADRFVSFHSLNPNGGSRLKVTMMDTPRKITPLLPPRQSRGNSRIS